MYEELPIDALVANPSNANRMSRMYIKKLRHNIDQLGFYETLTVRPHPLERGKFEILNGHARLGVLRELEVQSIKCDIWRVNDFHARLFLAILNRLRGSDVPELRMNLLLELLREHPKEELADHIPETARYLANLEGLDQTYGRKEEQLLKPDIVIMSFYLSSEQHRLISRVLDTVAEEFSLSDSSQALFKLAALYLEEKVHSSANSP